MEDKKKENCQKEKQKEGDDKKIDEAKWDMIVNLEKKM